MLSSGRPALWREGVRAAGLYAVCTFVLAYPLTLHPASTALSLGADTDLMVWALGWNVHAFTTAPLSLFDANIFHPYRRTLAYSENFIGSALLAAPIVWLTGNLVLAMNLVVLLSCVLCGVGAYLLCRRVGIGPIGAVVGGLIFTFAPPRFFRIGQLHLTTIQWVPFTMAALHAYLDFGRRRDLWWACAFFALQVLTSGHGAVFAAIGVAALLLWRTALGEPLNPAKRLRDGAVAGVLVALVGAAVLLPYLAVQEEMGLRRSLGEAYSYSPNLASFLASPTRVHAYLISLFSDGWILRDARAFLFPGYVTLALVVAWALPRAARPHRGQASEPAARWMARTVWLIEAALVLCLILAIVATVSGGFRVRLGNVTLFSARQPWRIWVQCAALLAIRVALRGRMPLAPRERFQRAAGRLRRWSQVYRRNNLAFYALLSLLTIWLSLGPPFRLYAYVYSWPGFSFIRVPSRFTLLTLLGLSVLAAAGLERLTSRAGRGVRLAVAAAAAALFLTESAAIPLSPVPYRVEIPAIDQWLAGQEKPFVVAEVPLASPTDIAGWERRHSIYMLHSMAHWQPTVHGYSGMRPALHTALYSDLTQFPDDVSLLGLSEIGVTHVVVHADWYPPGEWPKVKARIDTYRDWLALDHTAGAGRVYALSRPAADVLLRDRFDRYQAALVARDAAASAAFYTDDALVVRPGGRILRGRLQVVEWLSETPDAADTLTLDVSRLEVNGTEGQIEGRFESREGRAAAVTGRFLQVWRLVNGQWRLAQDLFSAGESITAGGPAPAATGRSAAGAVPPSSAAAPATGTHAAALSAARSASARAN